MSDSMAAMRMSRQEGIDRVYDGPSHVVLLGAGASIAAALHNPEASGKRLPSMADFVEVLDLADLIDMAAMGHISDNFEAVFSRLYSADPKSDIAREIEQRVTEYFGSMSLSSTPTIYDYLVMALRPRDLIATFNWDPFLYQAFCRNRPHGGLPHMSFLHGSVALGYSQEDHKSGPAGLYADASCTRQFVPTRLLFPVAEKDYNCDEFTVHEWKRLRGWLGAAKRITIFGYSAPDTDVEAVDLMSGAWGDPNGRNLEQVEMIDVQPESVVTERWSRFIHTEHYDYCTTYFDSSLATFPRRTGERFMHQFLPSTVEEAFQEPNPVPERFESLEEMWEWHRPLIEAEAVHEAESEGLLHGEDV